MIEGKTKRITPLNGVPIVGVVLSKPDITGGNGARHDVIEGKAELATRTTCNVFELFQRNGIPVSYIGRDGPKTFLTLFCDNMIPVEVVVRLSAAGSYCERTGEKRGTKFSEPIVEYFYKTTGKRIGDMDIPCDDPLMIPSVEGEIHLHIPNKPLGAAFGRLPGGQSDHQELLSLLETTKEIALSATSVLKQALGKLDAELIDIKYEFGLLPVTNIVVLADVVDCDSWRVLWNGFQLSKQPYRDGEDPMNVLDIYRVAAALTDRLLH